MYGIPTKIVLIVIAVAVILGVGATVVSNSKNTQIPGQTSSQIETAKVKFGYLPAVHALPLFVALENGYFKEKGIEVEVTKFEAPNQIIDALISNNIDMAMAAATGITAVAESKKPGSLKVFAVAGGDSTHVADGLIVHKDSSVKTISDLKNKRVGVLPGIQWRTIARNLFAANNLDIEKDITLIELAIPLQAQALASHQVDALLTIEPVLTVVSGQGISKPLMTSPNLTYIANPFYAGVGNVSVAFMNKNPKTFDVVMKIMDKATKEVNADPDKFRPLLSKYTPLSADLVSKVNLTNYKMYVDMTVEDISAVQKFIDVFVKYKVIESPIKATDLLISK